mmetsp:Transcript_20005/g.24718  ORF Transcript_20005/g.24718 Transcript_20005/m.24718 type:complete len:157 (+) Transcript_20005:135-605(+)|eukprot:CAMPEP_0172495032 /NCGR_PEP_ID=MMETSP1066-20121228/62430_1 /TAXON_ID=671091 /ORGANISM="Coscinodiscus wailesii, Strain CCMP2513" /LENGTH=156 /DNA_ID=CAMNT_0013266463 /DNA_START=135 /DNA_END=605 /DNA_ORIENTATION=+
MLRNLKLIISIAVLCLTTSISSFSNAFIPGHAPSTHHRHITSHSSLTSLSAGPATLDKPVTKKSPSKSSQKQRSNAKDKGWEIRLYNDPFNKREFVARCLMTITGLSDGAAFQVMMKAHQNGMAVVGQYHLERAEGYLVSLKNEGLMVDMVPVDDS